MRREHYQPSLSDRDSRADWEAKGAKNTWERAAERVRGILAGDGYCLPADIRGQVLSEIAGIVE
jgi:trimethylamine:corrinoid methyltransferase-like protein